MSDNHLKHTEDGGALQAGTKALGYKVTWQRLNTRQFSSCTYAHIYYDTSTTSGQHDGMYNVHHAMFIVHIMHVHNASFLQSGVLKRSQDCKSGFLTRQLVVSRRYLAGQEENFRFNVGATIFFRNRLLSAIKYGGM